MTEKEAEKLKQVVKERPTSEESWQEEQKADEAAMRKKYRDAERKRINYAMRLCCACYPAQLVPGLRIPIYEKPVTGEEFEDIAVLFERKKDDEDEPVSAYTHMEYWIVRFINECDMCLRSIHVRNEETANDKA